MIMITINHIHPKYQFHHRQDVSEMFVLIFHGQQLWQRFKTSTTAQCIMISSNDSLTFVLTSERPFEKTESIFEEQGLIPAALPACIGEKEDRPQ